MYSGEEAVGGGCWLTNPCTPWPSPAAAVFPIMYSGDEAIEGGTANQAGTTTTTNSRFCLANIPARDSILWLFAFFGVVFAAWACWVLSWHCKVGACGARRVARPAPQPAPCIPFLPTCTLHSLFPRAAPGLFESN
jgi:hypothetical protein